MPGFAAPASVYQIQTRLSAQNLPLKEQEAPVVQKRPAELITRGKRARRKVDNDDEREDIKTIRTLIPAASDAKEGGTNLKEILQQEKVENNKDFVDRAAELETPGTTSLGAHTVRPTGKLSWAEYVKLPCASSKSYVDRDQSSCAIPIPTPGGTIDNMVKPPGPTRQTSIHPRANPQNIKHFDRFDLTSSQALESTEPPLKKQRIDSDLGFPHRRPSIETVSGTHDRHGNGLPRNGSRSAASSVNPEQRLGNALDGFQMVSEFKKVDDMLHGSRKGRRYQPQKDSRGTSRQNTQEISDDDDPIVDDGPGFTEQKNPQSEGFTGTVAFKPAWTKEHIKAAQRPQRRSLEISPSFAQLERPATSGSQRAMVGGGNSASKPRVQDRMQTGVSSKRNSTEAEDISDDDDAVKRQRRGSHSKGHTGQVHSGSLSQAGDIKSSFPTRPNPVFKKASETEAERRQASFPVRQVKSREESYSHLSGKPACYKWSSTRHILNIWDQGKELYPTLVIDAGKIVKITCLPDEEADGRFFIHQLHPPMTPLMLVTLYDPSQSDEFLRFLKGLAHSVKVNRVSSEKMTAFFTQQNKDLEASNRRHRAQLATAPQSAEEIEYLKRRQAAKANSQQHQPESSATTSRVRRTLANSMTGEERTAATKTEREERPRVSTLAEMERPSTRSTRSHQVSVHRSPSPSLECWTDINRGWREAHWKGDEPLIYPPEGDKRATVDRRDIERLNEGEFLNDNLLQFYLRYLEEKTKTENPGVAKRVLFMNPFFYQRLTRGKGRSSIDYDGVKRWTSKLDIFEYDYVIVPVNEHAHWYLAVICNTPAFLKPPQKEDVKVEENDTSEAESSLLEVKADPDIVEKKTEADSTAEVQKKVGSMSIDESSTIWVAEDGAATKGPVISPKQKKKKKKSQPPVRKYRPHEPRIITMDSLGYAHSPTCSNLRDFLIAEAKARKGVDVILRDPRVGMTAKNIPEQNNHCDCGLFLLGYVEYFLENPDGMMHDIMQQKPEVMDRFSKLNASKMRADIRQLLFDLEKEQTERRQSEKDSRIAKRRAKEASEAGDSSPSTTEPTPAASPESSGAVSSDDQKLVAPNNSQKSSTEPAEEPSIIEVEKPAILAAKAAQQEPASPTPDFMVLIDDLSGYTPLNEQKRVLPTSQSVEFVGDRRRDSKLKALPAKQERVSPTQKSIEFVGTRELRSSPLGKGPEFAGRNALNASSSRRNTESLASGDEERSPEVMMESSVKKKTPNASMSPVPAPSAFKGVKHQVERAPSSDLDAPRCVVDLERDDKESDDLPSQTQRPKQILPTNTPSKNATTEARKSEGKINKDEAVEIPIKIYTPPPPAKAKLSERIRRSHTTNTLGGKHTKFVDDDDEDDEMILNGDGYGRNDDDNDSLFRGMSPATIRASATKKPSVEIVHGSSQIDFGEDATPKSIFRPQIPLHNSTPPKKLDVSSPTKELRSSPRIGRGRVSIVRNDSILPPPKKNTMASSSPSLGRTGNSNSFYGSSRPSSKPSSKEPKERRKGREEVPIVIDD